VTAVRIRTYLCTSLTDRLTSNRPIVLLSEIWISELIGHGVRLNVINPGPFNPWDAIGAKAVGLKVAWIERVTPEAMAEACLKFDLIAPLTMFRAVRMQMDELGLEPDYKVNGLSALPGILSSSQN
jgi:hypothetical protein